MPAWPVHIKIAKKVNEKLKFNEDNFIIGNVLPDVLSGFGIDNPSTIIDKKISHFRLNFDMKNPLGNSNFISFINKYKNEFNNPIVMGYLTHLLADTYYNNYFYTTHTKVENNVVFLDGKENNMDNIRKLKHHDFNLFSGYLHNKLGSKIKMQKDTLNLISNLGIPYSKEDIINTIDKVNDYILDDGKYIKDYKIMTEEELNDVLNKTVEFILTFLEENDL